MSCVGPWPRHLGDIGVERTEIAADAAGRHDLIGTDQHPAWTAQPVAHTHLAGGVAAAVDMQDLQPVAGVLGRAIEGDRPTLVFEDQQAVGTATRGPSRQTNSVCDSSTCSLRCTAGMLPKIDTAMFLTMLVSLLAPKERCCFCAASITAQSDSCCCSSRRVGGRARGIGCQCSDAVAPAVG